MENYRKAGVVEEPSLCPLSDLLHDGTPVVRVRDGSKIRNLMRFCQSRMEGRVEKVPERGGGGGGGGEEEEEEASGESRLCRQIVFTGVGPSVSKAITCVEILKRRLGGLHQVTRLVYSSLQETWEPLEPSAGLDSITVTRNIPGIWVLLSRDPLDPNMAGYQAPGSFDALWVQAGAREERESQRRKNGGRGKGPRRQTTTRPKETSGKPQRQERTEATTSAFHSKNSRSFSQSANQERD